MGTLLIALTLLGAADPDPRPPNVLLVIADDLGVDELASYGRGASHARTPTLDRLAARGLSFDRAYANPTCSPTRAELLTGRYPIRHRVGAIIRPKNGSWTLSADEVTLAERLTAGGLRTGAFGKWHLGSADDRSSPNDAGFERYEGSMNGVPDYHRFLEVRDGERSSTPVERYNTTEIVDDALRWLEEVGDASWFVWLAFHAPHAAVTPRGQQFQAPPDALLAEPLADDADDRAIYLAMIEALDTELGRLLERVDLDRTLVVFVGDNGVPFGVHAPGTSATRIKKTPYEGGVHVPLVIAGPDVANGRCDALVKVADLFPTIVEFAGAPATDGPPIDGLSLAPYFEDPAADPVRDHLVCEMFEPNGLGIPPRSARAILFGPWKLIAASRMNPFPNDAGLRLFNLEWDANERRDLLSQPEPLTKWQAKALERGMELLRAHLAKAPAGE